MLVILYKYIHNFEINDIIGITKLDITPKPDSMLRVMMLYKPLDKPIKIGEQKLKPFERKGFTVIEWGGTEVR